MGKVYTASQCRKYMYKAYQCRNYMHTARQCRKYIHTACTYTIDAVTDRDGVLLPGCEPEYRGF